MSPRKQKSIKKEPGTEEESTKKSEVKKETAKEAILTKHEIVGVSCFCLNIVSIMLTMT